MTYKLDPVVEKIGSPIILRFDDPSIPERCFPNGKNLADANFDRKYLIRSLSAENNMVIVAVTENEVTGLTNWTEEAVSFF